MAPISRRNILYGASGLGLALPFLESLAGARAHAATTPVHRVIFCFTSNGDQVSTRFPTRSETGFVLGEQLSPFEAVRADMLFLDMLNHSYNKLPSGEVADNHEQGGSALAPWPSGTGSYPIGGTNSTIGFVKGPSADYVLGERVKQANAAVSYRHLVYRVGAKYNDIWNLSSHAGPVGTQSPINPETNPFTAYSRIFTNLDTSGQALLARRIKMKQSALDLVKADLAALKGKVSAADKLRLEQHTTSMREIESSLTTLQMSVPACKGLTLPATFDAYDETKYKDVGFLFFKISAMAFACDLSRVVNFNWSGNTSDRKYPDIGINEGHHTISHNSDAASFQKIRAIKKNLFNLSLQLGTELKAIPEANGSVYDNTLIVHWSEFGQGDTHDYSKSLVMFQGGSEVKKMFRMGRLVDFTGKTKNSFSDMLPHVFAYMGFPDVTTFGDARLSGGAPLLGLT